MSFHSKVMNYPLRMIASSILCLYLFFFVFIFLQKFPNESLGNVVRNVFDFDRYTQEVFETLVTVLHKHGIPLGTSAKNVKLAKE